MKLFTFLSRAKLLWNNPSANLSDLINQDTAGPDNWTGKEVTAKDALRLAPVWRACEIIGSDIGALPLDLFTRQADGGRDKATAHPAYQLLRYQPHPLIDAMQFRLTLQAHACLRGNGYAWIERDGGARPLSLTPMDPDRTYPVRANGEVQYVTMIGGRQFKLDAMDVLHIRGLGSDGLVGYSVIEYFAQALGLAQAARMYGAKFFANAAMPRVVLEHPAKLSKEATDRLRESWNKMHQGLDKAHATAVLEEGLKAHPLSVSAKDAQLLELMAVSAREIAVWFGLPPHFLGDTTRTSFASLEQENQSYLDRALNRWLVTWESECRAKLLTEAEKRSDSVYVEFNRRALVRADIVARYNAYRIGTGGAPFLAPDEVRVAENMNPLGGKFAEPLLPSNNYEPAGDTPDNGDTPARAASPPAPAPAAPPAPDHAAAYSA